MKIIIISGFFNPLHAGHLDMIEAAARLGDHLIVIVNNDVQQVMKKGKVILDEKNRSRLLAALRDVDEVVISTDQDQTVIRTLDDIRKKYPIDDLVFANGGDRDSEKVIPEAEICHTNNIELLFGVGGIEKTDSSTRINQALGHKK
jgi:cytidyltransferase-like protein